jgi:hypothetical protein
MLKHEDLDRSESGREGRGMRQLITLLALAFVVTLGVVVGTRMSSDAIAVLVGVIAGVAASIPCALLLMAVTRRQEPEEEPYEEPRYRQAPPVIVVTPGAAQQQLPYGALPYSAPSYGAPSYGAPYGYPELGAGQSGRRQFRVMGYDEEEEQPAEEEVGEWGR